MQVNRCFGCMEETSVSPCPYCGHDYLKQRNQEYALQQGTILHGKYLIGRVLGQGGFGITYIGLDLALSRKVAIKEYFPASHISRDTHTSHMLQWHPTEEARNAHDAGREMFLKEARKMNRVDTISQVVHVQDTFEDNDTAYIVMDFIQGENLADTIKRTGPMSWPNVQNLLLPVANSMQKVHDAGLIHRDLSPDNLMIQPDGSIKILDLGAAKDLHLHSGVSSMQVAKSGFSPIEQYVMKGNSGPWTDVYSLAATIYFALTGVVPPSAVDRMDKDTLRWDLPQLRKVPSNVIHALQKAMTLQAKNRTPSMNAFIESIRKPGSGSNLRKILVGSAAAILAIVVLCTALNRKDSKDAPASDTDTAAVSSADVTAPGQNQEIPQESDEPWAGNVLVSTVIPETYQYDTKMAPVFNSRIARYQIISVTFLDSLDSVGSDSWDVSQARDGSVMAWTKPNGNVTTWINGENVKSDTYDLYIAAEGGINGKYCTNLFNGFQNVTTIDFNGCFHTDYAESMAGMFSNCSKIGHLDLSELETGNVRNMEGVFESCKVPVLDLSAWDTSNVETMAEMFYSCNAVKTLDLRSFDTSKVKNMYHMFGLTSALQSLDISNFDTSAVTDMRFMFSYAGLDSLDLTHFDTSKVTTMAYMFSGSSLKTLDIRGFDTSKVTSMQGMFSNCDEMDTILGITELDTSHVQTYTSFMDDGVRIDGKPWETLFD